MRPNKPNIERPGRDRHLARRGWLLSIPAIFWMGRYARAATTPLLDPASPGDVDATHRRRFIEQAFKVRDQALAAGDRPYGAIVVLGDRVVGLGPSRVHQLRDATAHAEMEAIRAASRTLGRSDLSGCRLYASSRPCAMCETAAYWANIDRFYFGSSGEDGGAPSYCG